MGVSVPSADSGDGEGGGFLALAMMSDLYVRKERR